MKGRGDLSLGNIIGANILNLTWVLGVCSLVTDLPIQPQTLLFDVPVLVIMTALLVIFGLTGKCVKRWEGGVLLGLYCAYLATTFTFLRHEGAMADAGILNWILLHP